MTTAPTTTLRLCRPFEADGRWIDAVVFDGEPGSVSMPVSTDGNCVEMDCRAFAYAMARSTGLTMAGITQMDAIDRLALALLLFLPASAGRATPGQEGKRGRRGH